MKKELTSPLSEVIIRENLKMKTFRSSMKNMTFFIIFPIQEYLNRMELWKRKISLHEMTKICLMITTILSPFRKKKLIQSDKHSNISYFYPFGCECFILNTKDNLGKFYPKSDKGIFLGYFDASKAYRVYNFRTLIVKEFIHVRLNDSKPNKKLSNLMLFFLQI
ncbi:hypothetical protein CR513_26833, partial [Mucuna pruriens]